MKKLVTSAAIAALISLPVTSHSFASPVTPVAGHAAAAEEGSLVLNAGVPIKLVVTNEVNSSTHKAGDIFELSVAEDVRVGDTIVIPRGTKAFGEITWRTGKGAFGKSGKMEFSMRYIDLGGRHVPVTGDYRQDGEGNTVATGVGVIAIGVFAGFITGKRARLPTGRELTATTAQPIPFDTDGHLSAAFDADAAMAEAEAKTPLGQCRAAAAQLKPSKQAKALKECYGKRME